MNQTWMPSTSGRHPHESEIAKGLDFAAAEPRKLLLADDHDLMRYGLRMLLDSAFEGDIEWREAANLSDAMAAYAAEPDMHLVLLDLNMADCKGLQGLRQFKQAHPAARIAVMSGTHDAFIVGQALALGAVSFLSKTLAAAQTRAAIVELMEQLPAPTMSGAHAPPPPVLRFQPSTSFDRIAELGPRHLEIMELVLSGCSNQEISQSTRLSLGTVKNYVSTILLALDVKSRSHLISLFH